MIGNALNVAGRNVIDLPGVFVERLPSSIALGEQQLKHQREILLKPPKIVGREPVLDFLQLALAYLFFLKLLHFLVEGLFYLLRSAAGFRDAAQLEVPLPLQSVLASRDAVGDLLLQDQGLVKPSGSAGEERAENYQGRFVLVSVSR